MRDIFKVREAMLEVVEDEGIRLRIFHITEPLMTLALYTAPEAQAKIWIRFCADIANILPFEKGRSFPWFRRFFRILNGSEDEERGWR